jgi:hypothetical protein
MIAIALVMIGSFAVPQIADAVGANPLQSGTSAVGKGLAQQNAEKVVPAGNECSILNPLTWGIECFYGMIGRIIWYTLVPALGWILGVIGQVTDFALNLQLGTSFFREPAIAASWLIIRDMCNMVFIFVLIYAGISTILNLSSANLKKVITGVIISALFINFSLYITRAIIDVSNIATVWFVQGVKNVGGGVGVSDSVKKVLQMEKLISPDGKPAKDADISFDTYLTGLALVALNLVAIYVFFNVGFLFIARIVSFMFLLITSPLGFIGGLGIGQLDELYGSWWKELRSQALMAPMFFLMLYLTLYIVDQIQSLVFTTRGATDAVTGNSFSAANYLMFAIIILMLLKCLSIAKEYSGKMGDQIAGTLKSATGLLLGGVTAVAGASLRQSAGRMAFSYTQDKGKMDALRERASTSMVARMQLAAVNKGASSSYDMRATKLGGGAIGAFDPTLKIPGLGKIEGNKVGKTEGGGFKAGAEEFAKKEKEWAEKNLGKGPAGAANRMRYAQSMQKSAINQYGLNPGVAGKAYSAAYDDMTEAAQADFRKQRVEGAKKATTGLSNQIMAEQVAILQLESAAKSNDPKKINQTLLDEKERMAEIAAGMHKKTKDAARFNELSKQIAAATGPEKTALEQEQKALTKNLTEEEEKKFKDDAKKIKEYEEYMEMQSQYIDAVVAEENVLKKKNMILQTEHGGSDSIGDTIRRERIGMEGYPETEKVRDASGKETGEERNTGKTRFRVSKGLAKQLQSKKADLKREQDEFDAIEGNRKKDKGKKGGDGGGKAEAKPADAGDADGGDDEEES